MITPPAHPPPDPDLTFGHRLRACRERAGKTRAVLGGLVGRSAEWVKALETGRLLTPRLPMLLRLAVAVGVDDLAELTGAQSLPVATLVKAGHPDTPALARALTAPPPPVTAAPDVTGLTGRVDAAWRRWHRSAQERTALAGLLPGLLGTARAAAHTAPGPARRAAHVQLARVYHLAQLFLAHQPHPELVWLAADRAQQAAWAADCPLAAAAAAWYYSHVYRTAGQTDAAAHVAAQAAAALTPRASAEHCARHGQLHLAVALAHAKAGRAGPAWRHHDIATAAAAALPRGYVHPWLMFGRAAVAAYAVTVETDLLHPGEATRRAAHIEPRGLPSRTRRAAYLIECARAHMLARDYRAVTGLLGEAAKESQDTLRHSPFARASIVELTGRTGDVGAAARRLALSAGLDM